MKISLSSAEFQINDDLYHLLFGSPKQLVDGKFVIQTEPSKHSSVYVSLEDVDRISMWQNYKEDIKTHYNSTASLVKDVNGQTWLTIGGTGWAYMWTVNADNLKKGACVV